MSASEKTKSAAAALLGLSSPAPRRVRPAAPAVQPAPSLSDEQEQALASSASRLVVTALAGSGKSRVLYEFARRDPTHRWQYLAFNKSMALSATRESPLVNARTVHSLAFARFGATCAHKVDTPWLLSSLSTWLGRSIPEEEGQEILDTVHRFMASADLEISARLVSSAWKKSGQDASVIVEAANAVWEGMISPSCPLPLELDAPVKLMQLSGYDPFPGKSALLIDEAQDLTPCIRSWASALPYRSVRAGDPYQSIYGWRMQGLSCDWIEPGEEERWLCGSWRFGPELAQLSDRVLCALGCSQALVGLGGSTSIIEPTGQAAALLARTRTGLVKEMVSIASQGGSFNLALCPWMRPALFEDGDDAWHVDDEEGGAWQQAIAPHRDLLACSLTDAEEAFMPLTAHASKGLTFDRVRLVDDFKWPSAHSATPSDDINEEARIVYVALTRAKTTLELPRDLHEKISSIRKRSPRTDEIDLQDSGF